MNVEEARAMLAASTPNGDEDESEPVYLPAAVLDGLTPTDLPEGTRLGVGEYKDRATHVEWSGVLIRSGDRVSAEIDLTWTRKYWYTPLNLEQYLDLVRRAVDTRQRLRGDARVVHQDDDGAYVHLVYSIDLPVRATLRALYDHARAEDAKLHEEAERASDEVGRLVAKVARRVDEWATSDLAALVKMVETASSANGKGRALEELLSRLLETVPGFVVSGRTMTATEEIDITVVNGSSEPRLSREGALVIAECKNWSSKCGRDEFSIFAAKLANRNERVTLGLLVSWNGFAETVTKEMLRGSRERAVVVPLNGRQIRAAAADGAFLPTLLAAWDGAVLL